MTQKVVSLLNDIAQRLLSGDVEFDLQHDILGVESMLLDIRHLEGCLLLARLSLMHMVELGISEAEDPTIVGMLSNVAAKRSLDFAPLITKLALEVRGTGEP